MNEKKPVFEFEQAGDVLIVVVHGPFMEFRDSEVREAYNEAYRRLHEPDTRHLLVDFSDLEYFGSTFVGILIRLAKKARGNKGEAALCHLSANMTDMLKTLMLLENTKTDFYWVSHPNREAALKALAAKSAAV